MVLWESPPAWYSLGRVLGGVKTPQKTSILCLCSGIVKDFEDGQSEEEREIIVSWCCMFISSEELVEHLLLHCTAAMSCGLWCFLFLGCTCRWPRMVIDVLIAGKGNWVVLQEAKFGVQSLYTLCQLLKRMEYHTFNNVEFCLNPLKSMFFLRSFYWLDE